ncbi:MAG: DoxX family protein [Anaerolineae bacterium]
MDALQSLFATSQATDILLLVLRIALGLVIFPHGAQKLLGWFGGFGYSGTMNYFTKTMHIPYLFGLLAIIAEFFGSLALMAGLLVRPAALGIGVTMLVAAWLVHRPNGFFMNWFGSQQGEGYEYFILAVGVAAVLVIAGAGAWSLDALLLANR